LYTRAHRQRVLHGVFPREAAFITEMQLADLLFANTWQTVMAKSPRPEDAGKVLSQASLLLRHEKSSPVPTNTRTNAMKVDTGVRMRESEDADTVLLEMPRGSPAEICVRINPGDRVLGSAPPQCSHP